MRDSILQEPEYVRQVKKAVLAGRNPARKSPLIEDILADGPIGEVRSE